MEASVKMGASKTVVVIGCGRFCAILYFKVLEGDGEKSCKGSPERKLDWMRARAQGDDGPLCGGLGGDPEQ